MASNVTIAGKQIGDAYPPFIIAELSGNHGQSFERAEALIRAAAKAGVDAIKLQTYTADTITLDSDREEFMISDASSLWRGENLYSLYQKAHTPWDWHRDLFQLARDLNIIAFSSPFDESSVDFLEKLDVPAYKIASFELNHLPLLQKVAATGKPIIMSTGMATIDEIEESLSTLYQHGASQIALLKCTSAYPASVAEANLKTIEDMKARFSVPVGLSDHSKGVGVSILAAGLGANLIERHFVLSHSDKTVDAEFSSTPEEFAMLASETKDISSALGKVSYGPSASEVDSLKYRRSIYVCKSLPTGALIQQDHIRVVRPGIGMHPRYFTDVIGRKLKIAKMANTPLFESDLE
jgi:N-acetylneuraminate synthase